MLVTVYNRYMSEIGVGEGPLQPIQQQAEVHTKVVINPLSTPEQVKQSADILGNIAEQSGNPGGFLQRAIEKVMTFGEKKRTIEEIKSGK